jgi:hypothetical protein
MKDEGLETQEEKVIERCTWTLSPDPEVGYTLTANNPCCREQMEKIIQGLPPIAGRVLLKRTKLE